MNLMSYSDKKNLLIVSISAPPKNAPESLQAGKYFKYLTAEYFNTTLITSKVIGGWRPYDEKLNRYLVGISRVIEVPVWTNRYVLKILKFFQPSLLEMPDSDAPFHWHYRYVRKRLLNKPDVIYSRSTPMSSSVLALKLKSRYRVPWVMHLSDPWVDNPYLHLGKKGRSYNEKMEALCFREADKITVTSQKTLELYKNKYPSCSKKLHVFPNVYDPDIEVVGTDISALKKLTFVHTGRLYKSRSAKSMLRAIEMFVSKYPRGEDQIDILFAGFADSTNIDLFEQCSLRCVKYLGALTYDESIALQQNAHVLVNIDSNEKDDRFKLFFPSKLLDYFLAQKTILCITDNNSTTHDVVNGKHGHCFTHDDILGIADYIEVCHKKFISGDKLYFVNPDVPSEFSARDNAQKLSSLLKGL